MAHMAKGKSRDKHSNKVKSRAKHNYHLRFLFQSSGDYGVSEEYVEAFSQKIKHENVSRSECTLHPEHDKIQPEPDSSGYVVILPALSPEKSFNPNEFFSLDLNDDSRQQRYYEITFSGKNQEDHAGLIIPDDALSYLELIQGTGTYPDPEFARSVLRKRGFEPGEVNIHQESPFLENRGKSLPFLDKLKLNLAWNTSLPLKEARNPFLKKLFFVKENPLFRLAFVLTALAIFILLPILSTGAGLSGDDEKHYQHAAKVYRYFTEDDPSALSDPQYKLNFYGQSFDFFTYLLIRLFNLEDVPYEARHVMIALSGAAAILFTGLLVKLLAGNGAGWLAMILMFLSPRFLGHAFNNPLDVPFLLAPPSGSPWVLGGPMGSESGGFFWFLTSFSLQGSFFCFENGPGNFSLRNGGNLL
jgi:hypothetical protein